MNHTTILSSDLLLNEIIATLIRDGENANCITRIKTYNEVFTPSDKDGEIVVVGTNTIDLTINKFACTVIDYYTKHQIVMAQLKRFIKNDRRLNIVEKIVGAFSQNSTMDKDYCNNFIRGLIKTDYPMNFIEKLIEMSDDEFKKAEQEIVRVGINYTKYVEGAFASLCNTVITDESLEYTLQIDDKVANCMAIYYRDSDLLLKLYNTINKTKYDVIVLYRILKTDNGFNNCVHITHCNSQIDLTNFIKFVDTAPSIINDHKQLITTGICDGENAKKLLPFLNL